MLPNKPLITLHSFLTWGNKACNLTVTVTVTVTVTNTNQFTIMNLDPWRFTYDPNEKLLILVVTLRLSSVRFVQLWADLTGEFLVRVDLVTRYSSYPVSCPENRLPPVYITVISWHTLPLISWHTLPWTSWHTYIRHPTPYINLSILALAWQLNSTLKVKVITLRIDHIKWSQINLKFRIFCRRKAGNLI